MNQKNRPDDSRIEVREDGTVAAYVGRDAVNLARARMLALSLRLYAKTGMRPTRSVSPTDMLRMAGRYTGKKYKRGAYIEAADGVAKWASEMRGALPTTDTKGNPL